MAVKEFHSDQEGGNEETTLLQVDQYEEEEEEEEETLSLCDLPIYNGSISAKWGGDFSKEYNGGDDKNSNDDNLFEFFSEEFTSSSSSNSTAENIIFCGKLITFKDIDPPRVESNSVQKGSVVLPWRPINKAKQTCKEELKASKSFACDYTSSRGNVSLVRSTTKSRWFLFMFGMPKLSTSSTEMKLRDIRNRQSRRTGPATMFPAAEEGREVAMKGKRSCKGMWKLLKSMSLVLSCHSSKIANDVVKAAFV